MKKQWIVLAVTLAFVLTQLTGAMPACAQGQPLLRVGSMTVMTGKFFTGMWGMNAADIDVRQLLHSYPTVDVLQDQTLALNPVAVRDMQVRLDEQGNRVHRITLHQDLYFSDGTPIKAQDYVFSVLLQYSPYIRELGGIPIRADFLQGGDAYQNNKTDKLLGLRLLNDHEFSLTVIEGSYPYYYDLTYINVKPYPLHVIAPGCEVEDSAQGAYLKGPFDATLLKETILDPQTGYLSHPSVTSGAYQLTEYDPDTHIASFAVNPYYKGNINGVKPAIPRLLYRSLSAAEVLPALKSGRIDLVNKVSDRQVRDEANNMPGIASSLYNREGLGFIAFLTEQDPVRDVRLRRALAHLVDKEALVESFLGEYGKPVDAYYGVGQWMAQQSFLEEPTWTIYPYDMERAEVLLEEAGYVYDQEGEAYKAAPDARRYKKSKDGSLKPLVLRMAITQDHPAAELLVEQMEKDLAKAGIGLTIDRITLPELMQVYYAQSDRAYDMLYLASNFYELFDPYYIFHTSPEYRGVLNATFIQDEDLMLAAKEMRETPSDQKDAYYEKWIAFQQAFTQALPMIPLYSNTYSDFYTTKLTGYNILNYYSFADAIVEAKLEE